MTNHPLGDTDIRGRRRSTPGLKFWLRSYPGKCFTFCQILYRKTMTAMYQAS